MRTRNLHMIDPGHLAGNAHVFTEDEAHKFNRAVFDYHLNPTEENKTAAFLLYDTIAAQTKSKPAECQHSRLFRNSGTKKIVYSYCDSCPATFECRMIE